MNVTVSGPGAPVLRVPAVSIVAGSAPRHAAAHVASCAGSGCAALALSLSVSLSGCAGECRACCAGGVVTEERVRWAWLLAAGVHLARAAAGRCRAMVFE